MAGADAGCAGCRVRLTWVYRFGMLEHKCISITDISVIFGLGCHCRWRSKLRRSYKMAQEALVHVISKADTTEHHTVSTDASLLPLLAANNIRLQTRLISLTANNLTYARNAAIANWWDAFPVPSFLPAPYNDTVTYGIVPAWGYAEVVESRTAGLEPGSIFWGFWPSSSLPIDLQLVPTQPAGHYIDITPHRQAMWSYYHRYTLAPPSIDLKAKTLAAQTVFKPLFECASSLNAYVLGPSTTHPAPKTYSSPTWQLADVSEGAAVISLAASGKTARAFNDAVLNTRAPGTGPQAFLAITSDPSKFSLPTPENSTVKTEVLSYSSALAKGSIEFLASLSPPISRIVIADFGARDNCLPALISHLRASLSTEVEIGAVGVGASPAPLTDDWMRGLLASMAVPERVQMNTSEVREVVVERIGEEAYFEGVKRAWEGFCARGGCEGVDVVVGKGAREFEEGWRKLCAGEAGVVGGLAYLL